MNDNDILMEKYCIAKRDWLLTQITNILGDLGKIPDTHIYVKEYRKMNLKLDYYAQLSHDGLMKLALNNNHISEEKYKEYTNKRGI